MKPLSNERQGAGQANTAMQRMPRLSCEKCAQRKVKCDRAMPCSNCQRTGVICVPVERMRLPRGRNQKISMAMSSLRGKQATGATGATGATTTTATTTTTTAAATSTATDDDDIRNRLARLESLVGDLLPDESGSVLVEEYKSIETETVSTDVSETSAGRSSERGKRLDSPFWHDLIQETRGLRDILDRAPEEEDFHQPDLSSQPSSQLLGVSDYYASPKSFIETIERRASLNLQEQLCAIFFLHVDPVFKMLHRPSVTDHLVGGKPYLHYDLKDPVVEALDYAIYYAAVACMTEDQCGSVFFGASKMLVVTRYRLASEAALARVDFVVTEDLTVLQAFVLFLIGTRAHDRSVRVWRLLSLALRIAQSLSLHNPPSPHCNASPFEREMRSRLWYNIGNLDVQAALERTTEPMIEPSWVQYNIPLVIDDSEFSFNSTGPLVESNYFCPAVFLRVEAQAQYIARVLCFQPPSCPLMIEWEERQSYVYQFQQDMVSLFKEFQDGAASNPFYSYVRQQTECMVATFHLMAIRPILRRHDADRPHVPAPVMKEYRLLRLAVTVIKKTDEMIFLDDRCAPWRWFQVIWAPWHALAVALAELCVCDHIPLLRSCWPTVKMAYERLETHSLSDTLGMYWRPMARMVARTEERMRKQGIMPLTNEVIQQPPMVSIGPLETFNSTSFPELPSTALTATVGSGSREAVAAPVSYSASRPPPPPPPPPPAAASSDRSSSVASATTSSGTATTTVSSSSILDVPSPNSFDFWPDLDHVTTTMDFMGTTLPLDIGDMDTSWNNWEVFVNDLQLGEDPMFTFG